MKKLLGIVVLGLLLITPSQADDIRDFEIEGIALEDSALKYFTEEEIKSNSQNFFRNKKYTPVQNDKLSFFETYDFFDFRFLTGDKNYIMHSIAGIVNFENKEYSECLNLSEKITNKIKDLVPNTKMQNFGNDKKTSGSTGTYNQKTFWTEDGFISVNCYSYDDKEHAMDHLSVTIANREYEDFITNDPY